MDDIFTKAELAILKLYLSSLTARRALFLFRGIIGKDNEYILSNLDPEKFVKYCDSSFGIHILTIKNEETNTILRKFISWINIPDIPYLVKTTVILSLFNKYKNNIKDIELILDPSGVLYVEIENKKTILASPIHLFQATRCVYDLYNQYSIERANIAYIKIPIDKTKLDDGVITAKIKIDNYNIVSTKYRDFYIPLVDGVETISVKEYLAKNKKVEYTYELLTWLQDGCIEYYSFYEDTNIVLRSTRPNSRIYITKKQH